MDKLQWFKFTPTDWIMGKIQRCPEVTQARFLRLCCLYWNKECILSYEDSEIEIDKEHLEILINKKIIKVIDNLIFIDFLVEQFKEIECNKEDKSNSAKIGNLKRWHRATYDKFIKNELSLDDALAIAYQSHPDSTPIAPQSQPNRKTSQRREDKSREEERIEEKKTEKIINNSFFAMECKKSEQWIEIQAQQNKVITSVIEFFIDIFVDHLVATEEQKESTKEFKLHFTNWIKKQDLSNFKEKVIGKTNQL